MANFYNKQGGNVEPGRKETGENIVLELPGGVEVPVTNVSFSEEANTSEVQFNTGWHQDLAVTGVSYSGSFEHAGRNEDLREVLWDTGQNSYQTTLPCYLSTMTIRHRQNEWSYVFSNVMVTTRSKDMPSDDRTSESYDFQAEKVVKN